MGCACVWREGFSVIFDFSLLRYFISISLRMLHFLLYLHYLSPGLKLWMLAIPSLLPLLTRTVPVLLLTRTSAVDSYLCRCLVPLPLTRTSYDLHSFALV